MSIFKVTTTGLEITVLLEGARSRVKFSLKHMIIGRRGGYLNESGVQLRSGMQNEPPTASLLQVCICLRLLFVLIMRNTHFLCMKDCTLNGGLSGQEVALTLKPLFQIVQKVQNMIVLQKSASYAQHCSRCQIMHHRKDKTSHASSVSLWNNYLNKQKPT